MGIEAIKILDEKTVFEHLLPKTDDLNKVTAGRLLVVAGCRSFSGAAAMAVGGALRCGCGYVTLASTQFVCERVSRHWMTPTYAALEESAEGGISSDAAGFILQQAGRYDALLLGCGLGNHESTHKLVECLLRDWDKPLILDADGINAASVRISMLKGTPSALILTPHEGEMSRLTGKHADAIHKRRYDTAEEFSRLFGLCLVLKGPRTLIASPEGDVLENHTGNSGLAKAGSGDILAGMIASLAAQKLDAFWAAACGVYLHGAAADLTARRLSKYAMQPTDLLDDLPHVFLRAGR